MGHYLHCKAPVVVCIRKIHPSRSKVGNTHQTPRFNGTWGPADGDLVVSIGIRELDQIGNWRFIDHHIWPDLIGDSRQFTFGHFISLSANGMDLYVIDHQFTIAVMDKTDTSRCRV